MVFLGGYNPLRLTFCPNKLPLIPVMWLPVIFTANFAPFPVPVPVSVNFVPVVAEYVPFTVNGKLRLFDKLTVAEQDTFVPDVVKFVKLKLQSTGVKGDGSGPNAGLVILTTPVCTPVPDEDAVPVARPAMVPAVGSIVTRYVRDSCARYVTPLIIGFPLPPKESEIKTFEPEDLTAPFSV